MAKLVVFTRYLAWSATYLYLLMAISGCKKWPGQGQGGGQLAHEGRDTVSLSAVRRLSHVVLATDPKFSLPMK